jgi:hypothetical protein
MNLIYCAGLSSHSEICDKHTQCAKYRHWWETPGTDMNLCVGKKYSHFVPIHLEAAAPVLIHSLPIGQTLELFA